MTNGLRRMTAIVWLTTIACTGEQKPSTEEDTASGHTPAGDTDTATHDQETGDAPPSCADVGEGDVTVELHLRDLQSSADITGAHLQYGNLDCTVDETGRVDLGGTPGSLLGVSGTADDYRPFSVLRPFPSFDALAKADLPSNGTTSLLASALEIPANPDAAIMSVTVFADEGEAFIGEVTVNIDAAHDAVLVTDDSAAFGIREGDTTVEGSESTVVFVNVAAGSVTPTFSHPSGITCLDVPGTVEAKAGELLITSYFCATD